MPLAPPRPCATVGCAQLVLPGARYCSAHRRVYGFSSLTRREVDRARGTRTERGYNNTWLRAAKAYRLRHPLCVMCERIGRLTDAAVTDHIVPHHGDQALFWDERNWQSLCKRCHDVKTASEDGPAHAMPAWLPTPTCEVTLVCGPPASGKSTLVQSKAQADDSIIDLDQILSELSGEPLYAANQAWLRRAIRERNRRLAALSLASPAHHAWVIVTGPKRKRGWWIDRLQPKEVIVLNVADYLCESRVLADPRRVAVRARQLQAIKEWWMDERICK